MERYTAQEESGSAEVCLAILDPTDLSNISPLALALLFVETVDGTAIGKIEGTLQTLGTIEGKDSEGIYLARPLWDG